MKVCTGPELSRPVYADQTARPALIHLEDEECPFF